MEERKGTVDNYIEDLNKSNPKLSGMISQLWQVQTDTEQYPRKAESVAHKLDEMIERTTQQKIHGNSSYWRIGQGMNNFCSRQFPYWTRGSKNGGGKSCVTDSQNYMQPIKPWRQALWNSQK